MKLKRLPSLPQSCPRTNTLRFRQKTCSLSCKAGLVWSMIVVATLILFVGAAYGQEPNFGSGKGGESEQASAQGEHGSLSEVGAKLSNPVSDVWALFTEFDLYLSDGDVNSGSSKVGGRMIFQPILPFPLFGLGEKEWKLITRPAIPVFFSQPVPNGFDDFSNLGGLADTQLPMMISLPSGNWLLGLGPTWLLPTATREEFGQQQWGVGPAAVKAASLFNGNLDSPADPRLALHIGDGRHYLLATKQRFDLITLEPPQPAARGVVNLYSTDFCELARERLAPGGILAQWWPIATQNEEDSQTMMQTILDVFPYVTV